MWSRTLSKSALQAKKNGIQSDYEKNQQTGIAWPIKRQHHATRCAGPEYVSFIRILATYSFLPANLSMAAGWFVENTLIWLLCAAGTQGQGQSRQPIPAAVLAMIVQATIAREGAGLAFLRRDPERISGHAR